MIELQYDETADAAHVMMQASIGPDDIDDSERLDADRIVRYGAGGHPLVYSFLNVRRFGVRLDDLEHRTELAALFKEAGFQERNWGHPIPTNVTLRRDRAAT